MFVLIVNFKNMKKLTPKERAEIYLDAFKYFGKKRDIGYGCAGFCDFILIHHSFLNSKQFKEYNLFKPRKFHLYWFPHTKEGKNHRLNALLFSYYMALEAKK